MPAISASSRRTCPAWPATARQRLKPIGRPWGVSSATEAAIRERGGWRWDSDAQLGVGSGTVQRVKRELVV